MQFNLILFTTAVLAAVSPAMSAEFQAFEGADCTGTILDTIKNVNPGDCVFFEHGGSSKSIHYANVGKGHSVEFYKSGGPNDKCTGNSVITRGAGSGCATAPTGFNLESVKLT